MLRAETVMKQRKWMEEVKFGQRLKRMVKEVSEEQSKVDGGSSSKSPGNLHGGWDQRCECKKVHKKRVEYIFITTTQS